MQEGSEVYVGLDTSKLKISVALAAAGREGEERFLDDIDSTPEAVERLVRQLAYRHRRPRLAHHGAPASDRPRGEIAPPGQAPPRVRALLVSERPGERG